MMAFAIDDLNGPGEQFGNHFPDPGSPITESDLARGLREATVLSLAPNTFLKGRSFLHVVGCRGALNRRRIRNRSFIADGDDFVIAGFCTPDRTEFDFPVFAPPAVFPSPPQFLGPQGDPRSIDA